MGGAIGETLEGELQAGMPSGEGGGGAEKGICSRSNDGHGGILLPALHCSARLVEEEMRKVPVAHVRCSSVQFFSIHQILTALKLRPFIGQ